MGSYKKKILSVLIFLSLFVISGISISLYNSLDANNTNEVSASNGGSRLNIPLLPSIDYTSLNKSWYEPKIEMVIVVPDGNEEFVNACKPLAEWKNQKGVKTVILSNYSAYPGRDDQEQIRNMLKSYYTSDRIRWVLLAGDAQDDLIPIRYVYNPDTVVIYGLPNEPYGSQIYKPTDYYYADLTGSWDFDGDEVYGENFLIFDEINWKPEVYVGRLPASTVDELSAMVNKTLKYEKTPELGEWINRMLLAGGISEPIYVGSPDGEDEARLTSFIAHNYVQDKMNYTHLCRTTSAYTPPEPYDYLSQANYVNEFNEGYSTVIFAGHGDYNKFEDVEGTIYTSSDAQACTNTNNPSLVYADACITSCYDVEGKDDNIGEILIKNANEGAIGYVGGLRLTLYYQDDISLSALNRANAKLFWKVFFEDKKFQQGKTLYDSKMAYMNSFHYLFGKNLNHIEAERKQLLTYCLLGDPEVDIYTGTPGKIVENPFPSTIYEGSLVELYNIQDNFSRTVPYPRLYITTEDGISRTVYGDKNGNVKFRLPMGADKTYNVSISGHNLDMFSNFSFTTQADEEDPQIGNHLRAPGQITPSTNTYWSFKAHDNQSGIESLFLIHSKNNFKTYQYLQFKNNFEENQEDFFYRSLKLEPGDYQYFLYARDYANHGVFLWLPSFQFTINTSLNFYFIIIMSIMIAIIAAIFSALYIIRIKNYPQISRKLK
jgi:hypothetical protein